MSEEPLFTLRELADRLSLPESTVRYYRDAFLDHIPSVGTGRRRRYPEPALAVLRTIARGYASGRTRAEILGLVEGVAPIAAAESVAPPLKQARHARARDMTEVTNLDLLAAIVDGEREQREALWQMAQEIVRLTQVLEAQEKVLGELSEHTGMQLGAPEPLSYLAGDVGRPPALGQGSAPEPRPAPLPVPPPAVPPVAPAALPSWLADLSPSRPVEPLPAPEPEPAPPPAPATEQVPLAPPPPAAALPAEPSDIERLREELGAERALVERLREAKLRLEQRTTEAEEAVAETRARRRTSVLGRLLKSDRNDS
jgi:DNA-binding transcriptional MerR regulator